MGALGILAEVFRQTRQLWPLSANSVDETVTMRIDSLKVLGLNAIIEREGDTVWIAQRLSAKEGAVQLMPISMVNQTNWDSHRILNFSAAFEWEGSVSKVNSMRSASSP